MEELEVINRRLGGHRITLEGVAALTGADRNRKWRIAEVGCGGGDNLLAVQRWAARKGIKVELTGIDINGECIRYASGREEAKNIRYVHSDYRDAAPEADIVFSSLLCHHFEDAALAELLRWKQAHSRTGFFINDLHRHPLAYAGIKVLTRAFSGSYLVRNDAPLSVQRSFRKKDWERPMKEAGIEDYSVAWKWAFRWLVVAQKSAFVPW